MWSASGLLGSRPASQVRRTWQMGQCSSPALRAERLAAAALWSQRGVGGGGGVGWPPRGRGRRRPGSGGCGGAGRVASPHSLLPRRVVNWGSPVDRMVWLGLQFTYVRMMRVSVVVRKWVSCLACCGLVTGLGWFVVGCPLSFVPCPCVVTPAPLFSGGCPLLCGGGVFVMGAPHCSPPLPCCGPPHYLSTPPLGLHPFGM